MTRSPLSKVFISSLNVLTRFVKPLLIENSERVSIPKRSVLVHCKMECFHISCADSILFIMKLELIAEGSVLDDLCNWRKTEFSCLITS